VVIITDPLEFYRDTFTKESITRMKDLVRDAQSKGVPVIVTRWIRTRGYLYDIFDEKEDCTQFVPSGNESLLSELADVKWDLWLDTIYEDAFHPVYNGNKRSENVLRQFLEQRGITHLILTGTWAEACVSRTAYTAAVFGLVPILLKPAIGGYDLNALDEMGRQRAHLVDDIRILHPSHQDT
jgi:nicotinamidase-related amidase